MPLSTPTLLTRRRTADHGLWAGPHGRPGANVHKLARLQRRCHSETLSFTAQRLRCRSGACAAPLRRHRWRPRPRGRAGPRTRPGSRRSGGGGASTGPRLPSAVREQGPAHGRMREQARVQVTGARWRAGAAGGARGRAHTVGRSAGGGGGGGARGRCCLGPPRRRRRRGHGSGSGQTATTEPRRRVPAGPVPTAAVAAAEREMRRG